MRECVKHLKLSDYAFIQNVQLFSQIVYFFLSTDNVQSMEFLPSTNEALVLSLMIHKLIVVVHS